MNAFIGNVAGFEGKGCKHKVIGSQPAAKGMWLIPFPIILHECFYVSLKVMVTNFFFNEGKANGFIVWPSCSLDV